MMTSKKEKDWGSRLRHPAWSRALNEVGRVRKSNTRFELPPLPSHHITSQRHTDTPLFLSFSGNLVFFVPLVRRRHPSERSYVGVCRFFIIILHCLSHARALMVM